MSQRYLTEKRVETADLSQSVDTSEQAGEREPRKQSAWQRWKPRLRLSLALLLPVMLETLDYTVVATAQPNIASVFGRLDLQSYIGTSYVLGSTIFLPVAASFADVFGRYGAMQASVFIFIVGSALSTGAINMPMLLLGRGISGVGAAGLLGIVRILLSDSESLDDNNAQNALMVVIYSLGFSIGPTLGGVLLKVNWRWIFGINLPIGVASMIIMHLLLYKRCKGPQPPQRFQYLPPDIVRMLQARTHGGFIGGLQRMDLIGAGLFIILGIPILLALNWGSTEEWNQPKVIACIVIGVVFLALFILWEYAVDHSTDHLAISSPGDSTSPSTNDQENQMSQIPEKKIGIRARFARVTPAFTRVTDAMLPINMFRSFDVVATDFAVMTSGMVMLGIFYFVAIFYIIVDGKGPVSSAIQLGIGTVISLILIRFVRQPKPIAILGGIVLPVAIGLLAQAMYISNQAQIRGFMIMAGTGIGISFGPLTYQVRFTQPEDRVAIVVASNLFFRTLGGTIGLAQLSAVMYSRVRTYITSQVNHGSITITQAGLIAEALNRLDSSGGESSSNGGIYSLPDQLKTIAIDAFRDGIRAAFWSLLPWLAVALVLCCFLSHVPEERLRRHPAETKPTTSHSET
ncbi:SubName: Full=Related to putative multidrug transporter {ECO:0000313/EMBL:CCA69717.1} [Serendipita indica DSM 11827]|nr:SubName: Full=Related to putative multidrug transporter {ECO:0000313/EMBL:CCA69717.1} [Serendipita indica DSM 11827]